MLTAIYARKSTEQNAPEEARSVTLQLDRARAYAAQHGWLVADEHVYTDDGVSGAEFEHRPGLMALLTALKPRAPFEALVVYDKDRIGREQFETSYLLKKIDQAGVRIVEAKGGGAMTFDSPIDKMVMSVLGFAEELERDKARTRTRDALQRKAERGYVAGGRCFGYDNVVITDGSGRRLHVVRQVNAGEAEVVRRIFTLTAEGLGLKRIAHLLNAEGALAPIPRRGGRAAGRRRACARWCTATCIAGASSGAAGKSATSGDRSTPRRETSRRGPAARTRRCGSCPRRSGTRRTPVSSNSAVSISAARAAGSGDGPPTASRAAGC
jgi:DNA invertase Pin-like site-specific DNA recombinase